MIVNPEAELNAKIDANERRDCNTRRDGNARRACRMKTDIHDDDCFYYFQK